MSLKVGLTAARVNELWAHQRRIRASEAGSCDKSRLVQ